MKSSSSYTIKNLPLIFFIELTFPFACCTEKSNILECVAPSKEKKSEQTEEMMQPRDVDKREDLEGLRSASCPVLHHLKTAHFLGGNRTKSERSIFLTYPRTHCNVREERIYENRLVVL